LTEEDRQVRFVFSRIEESTPNEEHGMKKKRRKAEAIIEHLQARFLQKELPKISEDEVLDFHIRLKKRQMINEIRSTYGPKGDL
jgi:hypothetical protein